MFCFGGGQAQKMFVEDLGMDPEKGGNFPGISFGSVVVETLSGRLFFQLDAMGYNRCEDIQGEGFFLKQGCLNQFGVQKIKMQILILCNGKQL